jgi:phytoene synthase
MADQSYLSIYAKSFNWAGFFLPKQTYLKCSALYDFCRVADNIADSNEAIELKKIKFLDFQNNFNNKKFDDPIIKNMWQLINEFNIPLKVVHDLLDGINSDIQQSIKLHKKKDLLLYSYRVAGTVGLMMAKILRVNKKDSLKSAIDLGIAMQLTNISRDVVEDLNFGRSYIDLNFEEIRSTIKLSESYYENSFYSIKEIPLAFRFAILVARRVYRKIGYKILKKQNLENYKKSGKIYVTKIEKIIETLCSVYDLIKLFLINKK